ncbi:MAG: PIN domain-containing protein [Raoultibacter sp.]
MKVCFDANVVIDILGKTSDFFYSYAAYDVVLTKEFDPCIPVTTLPSIEYVLQSRSYLSREDARLALGKLFVMFEAFDAKLSDCRQAYESDLPDFEDALIAYAAARNNVDFIITRNKKDFIGAPVAALTPQEFVTIYKPDTIEYETMEF